MQTSFKVFEIVKAMAEQGNPNSVTDAASERWLPAAPCWVRV